MDDDRYALRFVSSIGVFLVLLLLAAELGGVDSVSVLIEKNANLEARSDAESTPLHLAASVGAIDTVMILANAGANIGKTVLRAWLLWFPHVSRPPTAEVARVWAYKSVFSHVPKALYIRLPCCSPVKVFELP